MALLHTISIHLVHCTTSRRLKRPRNQLNLPSQLAYFWNPFLDPLSTSWVTLGAVLVHLVAILSHIGQKGPKGIPRAYQQAQVRPRRLKRTFKGMMKRRNKWMNDLISEWTHSCMKGGNKCINESMNEWANAMLDVTCKCPGTSSNNLQVAFYSVKWFSMLFDAVQCVLQTCRSSKSIVNTWKLWVKIDRLRRRATWCGDCIAFRNRNKLLHAFVRHLHATWWRPMIAGV